MAETQTVTIADFLLARIAEDEEDALAADGTRWIHSDKIVTFEALGPDGDYVDASSPISVDTRANGWHIVRWSPERALAECEAKKALVERASSEARTTAQLVTTANLAEYTLRALALPYAAHPDYRPEWRP